MLYSKSLRIQYFEDCFTVVLRVSVYVTLSTKLTPRVRGDLMCLLAAECSRFI